MENVLSKIEELSLIHDKISPEVIKAKEIKLGLRNPDGSGVVAGITTKGNVIGYEKRLVNEAEKKYEVVPVEGKLYYCNYDVEDIIASLESEKRLGFDETVYLLLTGELPSSSDLASFSAEMAKRRNLSHLERSIIMGEVENDNQMYALHSLVSHLGRCDEKPDSTGLRDVSRQCLNLIAKFPTIVAHNYNVMRYKNGAELNLYDPDPSLSTAENFLYMLSGCVPDEYEARIFDQALILHADHGGGNNSTFAVRVVSSSGANTYMAIATGIASLSGHLHGGANEHVVLMMDSLKKNVKDHEDDDEVRAYLQNLIDKKGGDGSGKLYGFGHAVYTMSDPRAVIFKKHAENLAKIKGLHDEFRLYDKVETIGIELLRKKVKKGISVNIDFYSGFVYKMMGIPVELFTPIFAMARVAGWSAHRIEQIIQDKIIRPAYISPSLDVKKYISLEKR